MWVVWVECLSGGVADEETAWGWRRQTVSQVVARRRVVVVVVMVMTMMMDIEVFVVSVADVSVR